MDSPNNISLNSIYNGINEILIVLNDRVEIQRTNHVVESLLLYHESELLNRSIGELIQKTDFDIVRDAIRTTYHEKKLNEVAFNFITKNNHLIPVSCSFSPLYDAQGKSTGILLVAKNISTLNNAKQQLQEKSEELNLFVYKASHDLKSPVASMMGLMALYNESEEESEKKLYFEKISECISKFNSIISDLLVLGRITYGDLELEQVDLKQLLNAILKSIEFVDGFKDINVTINIENNAHTIVTEKGLLHTILFNLIDNAVKYRRAGEEEASYINIHITSKDKGILFKIEDNGIGISDLQQANIFKLFYRATSASKGSGLGLYIVKTSVKKLEGIISVESVFGKGSSFEIYIPSGK